MGSKYNLLWSYLFSASHRPQTGRIPISDDAFRCCCVVYLHSGGFLSCSEAKINRSWFLYGDRDLQRSLSSSVSVDFQPVTDEMRRKHSEKEPKRNAEKEDRRCGIDINPNISIRYNKMAGNMPVSYPCITGRFPIFVASHPTMQSVHT